MALGLKLGLQLLVIVDAAVEGDGQTQCGIDKGLGRLFRQIDNLQTAVSEPHRTPRHDAGTVRPERGHGIRHSFQPGRGGRGTVEVNLAANTAHG